MITLAESKESLLAPLTDAADVFICRIRAMSRLYWQDKHMLFYTNSINCSLYVENGNAMVWLSPDSTASEIKELCDLLSVTARTIRINRALPLAGYAQTTGRIYGGRTANVFTPRVEENLRDCLAVWQAVFPVEFSGEAGQVRYADCSHRIRHGISRAFCFDKKAALLVFCKDSGYAVIDQLAVLPGSRGNGYAVRLLSHAAAMLQLENGFLFESRDAQSDHFYEKNKFRRVGEWYAYIYRDVKGVF